MISTLVYSQMSYALLLLERNMLGIVLHVFLQHPCTFGGGLYPTFADFIGHLSLCFLNNERYCEHFLEMKLHMYSLTYCVCIH